MANDRKPFQPLEADIDDKLEKLALTNGVGTMTKPQAERPQGREVVKPLIRGQKQAPSGATPRNRMKNVSLDLPDYVWTELKIRAAQNQTSLRYIIMKALRKDGITIAEADMVEDGRTVREGNATPQ
jgi:hypothetical protein